MNRRLSSTLLLLVVLLVLRSTGVTAPIVWSFAIIPPDRGGSIFVQASPSFDFEYYTSTGHFPFDSGSRLSISFIPASGFELKSVTRDGTDVTASLSGGSQLLLNNVTAASHILATFSQLPAPTGDYTFAFPTRNPSVTPIALVAGHYVGSYKGRSYDLQVTENEFGKLSASGTFDGLKGKNGGTAIDLPLGTAATIDGRSTVKVHTTFSGSFDDKPVSGLAAAHIEANNADLGNGTQGVVGDGSYRGHYDDQKETNDGAFQIPLNPEEAANVRKGWSLKISLVKKAHPKTGQPYIAASGEATLPNDHHLTFPEQSVRYSFQRGYTFILKRGTDHTVVPETLAKGSIFSITHLKFTPQGTTYVVESGRIDYKFLGQRGHASLTDFQ